MQLTTAMARFADVADLIKIRSQSDEALKDLCEDYQLARETLTNLKKMKPRRSKEISEYKSLILELEDEIIRTLLGVEDKLEN
ncbi:hypothetical protein SAZ10_04500 [Mesorhizobium sp. BAC0120]|uniref:hypothetical protein n=1 Tax=Mesorhizobium sp. BAC0120 TaxID=3090670 RepID=UPI00298C161B|nr:hypothetical protein [Mesorhizobium sp. BAC0120]MDW6021019.1 hypothetical protein [Mesorhizobium sp. BAC0120]